MSVSTIFSFLLSNCPHNNSHFQKGRQYRGQSLSPHACSLAKKPLTGQESNTDYYTTVHRIHLCLGVSVLKQNTFCWSTWRVLKDWWQYLKNLYGTFSFSTYPFKKKIFHWVSVHFFLRIWFFPISYLKENFWKFLWKSWALAFLKIIGLY